MAEKKYESQKVTSKKNTMTGITINHLLTGFPNGRNKYESQKMTTKKIKGQE